MATAKRRSTSNGPGNGPGNGWGNSASKKASSGNQGGGNQGGGYRGGGWRSLGTHLLLVAIVLFGIVGVFYKEPVMGYTNLAASYGARTACSCRYVAGRDLDQCRTDFEPGMGIVFLSEDEDVREITARVPLIASQTARYSPASGCVLEPWDG